MPFWKGIQSEFDGWSLEKLAPYCLELHRSYGVWRQHEKFHDVKGNSWSKEDFWNFWRILDRALKAKGGKGCQPLDGMPSHLEEECVGCKDELAEARQRTREMGKCQGVVYNRGKFGAVEELDEICFCDGTCVPVDIRKFDKIVMEMNARGANRMLATDVTPEYRKKFLSEGIDVQHIELSQMEKLDDDAPRVKFFLVGAERRKIADFADGVMLNAVQVKKREQLEPWRSEYKGKIMLDNGIFGDVLLSVDELTERVNTIVPDIAVGPDVLFDHDIHLKSIKRQKEFVGKKLPDETEIMLVPQGNTCLEYEWCIGEVVKMKPDVIGLGRMSMKIAGYPGKGHRQRLFCFNRLEKLGLLDKIHEEGIKIHALGLSKPWELPYMNKYKVYSLDSMSYIYSSLYHQLAMPGDETERMMTVLHDGTVKKSRDIDDQLHARRCEFSKTYPFDKSLDERQQWIVKNVWHQMAATKATDHHVLSSLKGLRWEDRDDTPMLEKPRKEKLRQKVFNALQEGSDEKMNVSDLQGIDISNLDNEELLAYHFLLHNAYRRGI